MTIETELPAVKVKPLEWKDGIGLSTAQTNIVACYSVWDVDDEFWLCSLVDGRFPSMEAAKSAAQGDYERRILSALVPSTPAELVTREDLCQFIRDKAESHKGMLQDDFWPFLTMYLLDNFSIQRAALKELGKGDGR